MGVRGVPVPSLTLWITPLPRVPRSAGYRVTLLKTLLSPSGAATGARDTIAHSVAREDMTGVCSSCRLQENSVCTPISSVAFSW